MIDETLSELTELANQGSDLVFKMILENPQIPTTIWATIFWTALATGNACNGLPWKEFEETILEALAAIRPRYIEALTEK